MAASLSFKTWWPGRKRRKNFDDHLRERRRAAQARRFGTVFALGIIIVAASVYLGHHVTKSDTSFSVGR